MNYKMPFVATWMDIEIIITKWSKSGKNIIPLIYGILKNDTNELIDKTETDSENKFVRLSKGKGWGEGIN